jgi:hypothetical protein
MEGRRRREPAPAQGRPRSQSSTTKTSDRVADRPDGGPSLAELVELTGATPGEVLVALWALREAEREQRP